MNWLAHVFLSPPDIHFQLGNLLADSVRRDELEGYSEGFRAGYRCHMAIDRFTDSHPRVRVSKGRIFPQYRHFAPVLVDVYYDHLLVRNWDKYSDVPYQQFVDAFYVDVERYASSYNEEAADRLRRIVQYDVLGCYDRVDGVSRALGRMMHRIKRPGLIDISTGADALVEHLDGLEEDFQAFFPELLAYVEAQDFYTS